MAVKFGFSKLEGFDWNKGNLEHIKKHKVGYEECEQAFLNNPLIVTENESHSQLEKRIRVYGRTNDNRLVLMIITIRNNKIRVISARDQSIKERKEFQKTTGGENL